MGYFESLVNGPWDNDRFLTCPPQSVIEADFSEKKFRSVPAARPIYKNRYIHKADEAQIADKVNFVQKNGKILLTIAREFVLL